MQASAEARNAMPYDPTWEALEECDPGFKSAPAFVIYDQSEGFSPAYALVMAEDATEAVEIAEALSNGRLSDGSESLVVRAFDGERS